MKSRWNIILLAALVCMAAPAMAQPAPFVIDGYVFNSTGDPCNSPAVQITNTGDSWDAQTTVSNDYQLVLDSNDVTVDDILQIKASGCSQSKTVEHTVTQAEINDGGFSLNITLIPPTTTTYNFTTGAGLDKWAYRYQNNTKPPVTNDVPGIVLTAKQYVTISTDNGKMQSDSTDAIRNYAAHRFVFNITQPVGDIVNISVLWNGKGAHTDRNVLAGATLYIWNGTAYKELANTTSNIEVNLIAEITEEIGSYIDATGKMTILVMQNSNQTVKGTRSLVSKLSTDFVKVDITHT